MCIRDRLKRLERFKRDKALDRPREEHTLKLQLQTPLRSGDKVIWTQDLEVGYDPGAPLFCSPDLDLRRGECVALLGPNGSGKTTFLKTVLGEIEPLAGYARLGASLKTGYFAQVHADLDPSRTVLDSILDVKNLPLGEARSFLGRFLFSGDDVFKLIGELSGGERSRVALARLVMQRANFLLLDEPTNHLDIASQEVLEEVLDDFEGTIVLVTHDRYLVDRLATQLWVIDPETEALKLFRGTWAEYLEVQSREAQAPEVREAKDKWSRDQRQARREEQRLRREEDARRQRAAEVEEEIHQLEAQLKALKGDLDAATEAQEAMRLHELGTLYGELENELQQRIELWAELAG